MLQPQKFEFEIKYEGSSQGSHIRVLCQISKQIAHTSSMIQEEKSDSKYIQVNAEKYITI